MAHRIEQWTVKSYVLDRTEVSTPQLLLERTYELEKNRTGGYQVVETDCRKFVAEQEWSAAMKQIEEHGAKLLPACLTGDLFSALEPGEYVVDELLGGHK